jgi:hypothetical protein
MALTQNSICAFGWKARDFALKGVDGKTYSLADARGPKGTLVIFICNHCPYLKSDEFSFVFLRRLRFGDGRRPIAL